MGEAKRRADERKAFLSGLTTDERIVFDLTQRLLDGFIKPLGVHGACYRISVLLNRVLAKEYALPSEVVLGWINDGDDIFISHAWLQTGTRKTDLMAERPMHAANDRGPTIILDHEFRGTSNVRYTYHLEKTPAALVVDAAMVARDPEYRAMLKVKDADHAMIAAAIASDDAKDAYLDDCARETGDGCTYSRILALIGS